MSFSASILGILLALTSAFVWGSGDFTGGYATRRQSQFHVLALSALSGLLILIAAALISRESFPSLKGSLWAMLGGASGALGIAALYRALSMGHIGSVAPTSGVISAAVPAVFFGITQGSPGPHKLLGFGLALAGIWLVSSASSGAGKISRRGLLLAYLSGVGFGCFFIFLGLVEAGKIFTPLILARSLTFVTGLVLIRLNRLPFPALTANPLALLAGILDAGGNLFYILAKQFTRLDVTAVLASLYPASTVLLAGIILKEKLSRSQWFGLVLCLAAIALITV